MDALARGLMEADKSSPSWSGESAPAAKSAPDAAQLSRSATLIISGRPIGSLRAATKTPLSPASRPAPGEPRVRPAQRRPRVVGRPACRLPGRLVCPPEASTQSADGSRWRLNGNPRARAPLIASSGSSLAFKWASSERAIWPQFRATNTPVRPQLALRADCARRGSPGGIHTRRPARSAPDEGRQSWPAGQCKQGIRARAVAGRASGQRMDFSRISRRTLHSLPHI